MGHMINSIFMFEDIDNEILVCDTASSLVVHLTGAEAAVVRDLLNSQKPIEFSGAEQAIADRLAEAGVVVEVDPGEPTSDFSRRKMLQLSAVGAAAAGLTVLALPTAAAAASGGGGSTTSTSTTSTTVDPSTPNPVGSAAGAALIGTTINVIWDLSGGAAFNYTWAVSDGATGTGTAAANGLVSTGVSLAAGQSATVLLTSITTPAVEASFGLTVPVPG